VTRFIDTPAAVQELLVRGYAAFNARDIDTVLSMNTTVYARTGRISGVSSSRLSNPGRS
jgi:hypothetical protein